MGGVLVIVAPSRDICGIPFSNKTEILAVSFITLSSLLVWVTYGFFTTGSVAVVVSFRSAYWVAVGTGIGNVMAGYMVLG
jgi:hypothetical protein